MNLTISIPEQLYKSAKEIAAAENVSVEELFASAFEERILEFERLKTIELKSTRSWSTPKLGAVRLLIYSGP